MRFIIDALELPPESVAYIAFTGQAAQVLGQKGCPNACTAHHLLYKSFQLKDGSWRHMPRTELEGDYSLIVVDEVSMLPEDMWQLLLKHRKHIIACGDPFQLPSITEGCTVLDSPHIFLTEIMRQAAESEIIRLTMDIREGKRLQPFKGKEINVVHKKDFVEGMLRWADQSICATNDVRRELNTLCRKMKFGSDISPEPVQGDKLICLKNNFDHVLGNGVALVNGLTGTFQGHWTEYLDIIGEQHLINFEPSCGQGESFNGLFIDWKLLVEGKSGVTKENFWRYRKAKLFLEQFDYGYVITCWKAQGGEFPKVLVLEENFPFDKETHQRFLYTAATRASEKLTLVLKS